MLGNVAHVRQIGSPEIDSFPPKKPSWWGPGWAPEFSGQSRQHLHLRPSTHAQRELGALTRERAELA